MELKPCPFCNDRPMVFESRSNPKHILYSVTCYGDTHAVSVGWFDSEEEAIEAWNRRVNDG